MRVFITIDTEYSSGLYTGPGAADRADNFARSIACLTPQGPAGIPHKLDLLARHGQCSLSKAFRVRDKTVYSTRRASGGPLKQPREARNRSISSK